MAIYDLLADLPLEIESYELNARELGVSSDFVRRTTVVRLRGGGHEGIGEDVTYDGDDQLALQNAPRDLPLASQAVRLGEARVIIAGGMESMSQAPYLLRGAREGLKFGNTRLEDSMIHDGLWCAFEDCHMGEHAEFTATTCGIGRIDQDRFAAESQQRAARAVVFPSIWEEPFGLTIIEAYASGTPVIAARVGAPAELVEDGVTGLTFRPGDAEDLAQRLRWALTHPTEMAAMGAEARRRYDARFTAEANHRDLLAVYAEAQRHRRDQTGADGSIRG